jgi:hypothetical protein
MNNELIQIRPRWDMLRNNTDCARWSRIHPRFKEHSGCIVDLGCLGWNKRFDDITSDNWAGYFYGKKRVIGVDPQESPNPNAELFSGFVHNFTGKADLISSGVAAYIQKSPNGKYDVLTWKDFKNKFNIDSISILKINIEGSEWDLLDTFDKEDYEQIDQICISFHDWLPQFKKEGPKKTWEAIDKIKSNGFEMTDLGIYGWKHFLKIKD